MEGWLEIFFVRVVDLGCELVVEGVEIFIFMDIVIDGMLLGLNIESIVQFVKVMGKIVIVLGGVSLVVDLKVLVCYKDVGVLGVIIGKVLYIK